MLLLLALDDKEFGTAISARQPRSLQYVHKVEASLRVHVNPTGVSRSDIWSSYWEGNTDNEYWSIDKRGKNDRAGISFRLYDLGTRISMVFWSKKLSFLKLIQHSSEDIAILSMNHGGDMLFLCF